MPSFADAPFIVIWEVTRACALACLHCRAGAIARRDPCELTTEEGYGLLDAVRQSGSPPPLVVLTRGHPMRRPDLAAFFLIQTGRRTRLDEITAHESEWLLHRLCDLSLTAPFGIKTTEGPHDQRVTRQRDAERRRAGLPVASAGGAGHLRAPRGVTEGNGFVFIDHRGAIRPSGFLPLACGNVRTHSLVDAQSGSAVSPTRRWCTDVPAEHGVYGPMALAPPPGAPRRIGWALVAASATTLVVIIAA